MVTCYRSSNPTEKPHPMVRNPNSVSLQSHGKLFDPAIWNPEGQPLYVLLKLILSLNHIKVLKDFSPDSPLCWCIRFVLWFLHWLNVTDIYITLNLLFIIGKKSKQKNICINLIKIKKHGQINLTYCTPLSAF